MVLRRQSARRTLTYAVAATAFVAGLFAKTTFTELPAASTAVEPSRRSAVLATGLVATPDMAQTEPAPSKQYKIFDAYNISFPPQWEVLASSPQGVFVQGNKNNVAEKMSAAGRKEDYGRIEDGFGDDPKVYGEQYANVMTAGKGKLVDSKVIFLEAANVSAYQFELANDYVHELWFITVLRNEKKEPIFCNVALRTTPESWDGRKAVFKKILSTFTPLTVKNTTKEA